MTSSEPSVGGPSPEFDPADDPAPVAPAAAASAVVIATGHLHPGMLFLRMLDHLRQAVLPLIVAFLTQAWWLVGFVVTFFVLAMVWAVVRYLTFQYRLTADELVTTEGILHRQERRIPVNRIQDLNFESTLLRRLFGLVVVSVETASGQGAEASLDSLSKRDAIVLREALYRVRAAKTGADPRTAVPPQPAETLLFRATSSELALLGMTNNRLGAILLAFVGIWEFAGEIGLGDRLTGSVGSVLEGLATQSSFLVALILAATLFLFLLGGWLLSVVASFVMFHGFALTLRGDVLQRRFGLITTRAQTLPRRKVQRVIVGQTLVRRLLRTAVVRADSAGSGMGEREEAPSGRDIIAPLCRLPVANALLPWLLTGFRVGELVPWRRVSPLVVWRVFLKGVLLTLVLLAIGLPQLGLPALSVLLILPVSWAIGVLAYDNLAYAEFGEHFCFRWGITGRYRAFVPLRKVQGVVLRAGPVERLLGLASLTVYVAGGSPTTQANLPRGEAERLEAAIAARAAASRFVW